jgi:hypothetical protein
MNITDEMVHVAVCEYLGLQRDCSVPNDNIKDMRKALDAAMQAAWIKFDINDESTHPQNLQQVIVLYHTGIVSCDEWSILKTWMYAGCKDCVTLWMPLPKYKGE